MPTALITGANVGQANMLVKKLAARGWRVFAGVLPGAETDLKTEGQVTLVDQDVSDFNSVRASAKIVDEALGNEGLDLIMNVAGVANVANGTIEGLPLEDLQKIFAINTFGQTAICQCFLPMMRRASKPGKIFNFGSGAVVANPPTAGAYNMSKHAVHGLTLTLRLELAPFGIQVTSIWPGSVKTGMTANSRQTTLNSWNKQPEEVKKVYEPYLKRGVCEVLPDMIEKKGNTSEYVTDEVLKLLDRKKLKPFYLVGKDAKPLGPLAQWLPSAAFEGLIRTTYKIPSGG